MILFYVNHYFILTDIFSSFREICEPHQGLSEEQIQQESTQLYTELKVRADNAISKFLQNLELLPEMDDPNKKCLGLMTTGVLDLETRNKKIESASESGDVNVLNYSSRTKRKMETQPRFGQNKTKKH